MTKIVFATGNRGKLREASEILGEGFELVTPADFGITEDIPETGETLEENSLQKARYIYDRKGCDCFADDTGLEVDALGGAPGVYTARYAGPSKDFNLNMDKVLAELAGLEATGRGQPQGTLPQCRDADSEREGPSVRRHDGRHDRPGKVRQGRLRLRPYIHT